MDFHRIIYCIAATLDVKVEDIQSQSRRRSCMWARRMFIVIALKESESTLTRTEVAQFVLRDRATVNYHIVEHEKQMSNPTHKEYRNLFNRVVLNMKRASDMLKMNDINRLSTLYQQRIDLEIEIAELERTIKQQDSHD